MAASGFQLCCFADGMVLLASSNSDLQLRLGSLGAMFEAAWMKRISYKTEALGSDQKNKMAITSSRNEFPSHGDGDEEIVTSRKEIGE